MDADEEKAEKQRKRDEETARRRLEDPDYQPPPPLTVPKGKPTPPADYKYPESARKHGFGPPLDSEEEKKEKEREAAKKEQEEREVAKKEQEQKEKEQKEAEEKERKQHHPTPETSQDKPKSKKTDPA